MKRDFTKRELENLKELEGQTLYHLGDEICDCFDDVERDIDIWDSDNFIYNDGRKCLAISSDSIDEVYNLVYIREDDGAFTVLEVWI